LFKRILTRLYRNARIDSLAVCSACGDDFVHPVCWHPDDDEHWSMLLRCGGCGERREVTLPDIEANRFDRELDEAERQIELAADRLSHERFEAEVQAFTSALEHDLIDAADFARHPDA
jgi:hypothetical protein